MTAALRRGLIVLSLVCLALAPAFAQADQPSSGLGFKMGMGIGVQTFNDSKTIPIDKSVAVVQKKAND